MFGSGISSRSRSQSLKVLFVAAILLASLKCEG